jgi:phosphotransacetylase
LLSDAVDSAVAKIIMPVLVGPKAQIRARTASLGLDLTGLQMVDTRHSHPAGEKAIDIVRAGEADASMNGSLHTDESYINLLQDGTQVVLNFIQICGRR